MRLWPILLLAASCFAQRLDNYPQLHKSFVSDGQSSGAGHYIVAIPDGVATGEEIVACAVGSTAAAPFNVTDTINGNTFSSVPATSFGSSVLQTFYINSTGSGADTVDLSFTGGNPAGLIVGVYKNVSGTLDGSAQTNTGSGSPATLATNHTTTVNGDLPVSCGFPEGGGTALLPSPPESYTADDTSTSLVFQAHDNWQAIGAHTFTWKNASATAGGTGLAANVAMQTIVLKPSTIAITDTALFDCATGVACEEQLHCVGGTAALTYSVFSGSLPTGLSLNTATGEITGTPTGTTQTVGFRCTDGTVTSATATLTLTIGATFNPPSIRQAVLKLNASGTTTFSTPVQCGSVLVLLMHGFDSHGGDGWIQADNDATNNVKDGMGNVLHRIGRFAGTANTANVAYISDPITYSGTGSIIVAKTTSGSPLMSAFLEVSGAQGVVNYGAIANSIGSGSSPFTLANSYTSLVANELLLGFTASSIDQDTYSLSSPFFLYAQGSSTCQVGFDCIVVGDYPSPSVTSTTLTTTVTSPSPSHNNTANLLFGLRPGLPVAGCPAVQQYAGEKIRRQVY